MRGGRKKLQFLAIKSLYLQYRCEIGSRLLFLSLIGVVHWLSIAIEFNDLG